METTCFECGRAAHHDHHVVPKSLGGTRTVPLCLECHSKIHGRQLVHAELIRAGLRRKKERVAAGLDTWNTGRPKGCPKTTPEVRGRIHELHNQGVKVAEISRLMNLSRQSVYTVLGDVDFLENLSRKSLTFLDSRRVAAKMKVSGDL